MVIAEAGFYSVPTVSTDVGGVREFIIDKKNGILVTANAESIANQIELLMRDKELRALIGNEARKSTESRFTAEIFVADHKDAYLKLVPIRKSPR